MEEFRLETKAGLAGRSRREMMILVRIGMRRAQAVTSTWAFPERQGRTVVDRHPWLLNCSVW